MSIMQGLRRWWRRLARTTPDGALHLPTGVNTQADSSNITIWYPEK